MMQPTSSYSPSPSVSRRHLRHSMTDAEFKFTLVPPQDHHNSQNVTGNHNHNLPVVSISEQTLPALPAVTGHHNLSSNPSSTLSAAHHNHSSNSPTHNFHFSEEQGPDQKVLKFPELFRKGLYYSQPSSSDRSASTSPSPMMTLRTIRRDSSLVSLPTTPPEQVRPATVLASPSDVSRAGIPLPRERERSADYHRGGFFRCSHDNSVTHTNEVSSATSTGATSTVAFTITPTCTPDTSPENTSTTSTAAAVTRVFNNRAQLQSQAAAAAGAGPDDREDYVEHILNNRNLGGYFAHHDRDLYLDVRETEDYGWASCDKSMNEDFEDNTATQRKPVASPPRPRSAPPRDNYFARNLL
eukprot:g61568.t1